MFIFQTHHSIYDDLLGVMSTGSPSQIVGKIMSTQDIAEGVTEYVLNTLKQEVKGLCSKAINSILRNNSKKHLLSFSFKKVAEEWIEKAPLFHKFIICSSTNPSAQVRNKLKKGDSLLHAQVAAGCKLLNIYSREMKCLQQINNIIMLKGGMKKSGFTRMQSTNDCQSYDATIDLADTLANQWDEDILKWQNTVKSETEIESQLIQQISYIGDTIELCGGHANEGNEGLTLEKEMLMKELRDLRTSMHPGYYFVGDNVDMVTKVRHMTVSNQHKDQHMFQMCAYLHRVSGNELDNTTPLQDAKTALFSQLVPSAEEKELMLQHFTYLVAKQWCTYLDHFAPYEAVIPPYIDHPHLKETKTRTARVRVYKIFCLFVWVEDLRPSEQFFRHVRKDPPLPGYYPYFFFFLGGGGVNLQNIEIRDNYNVNMLRQY